MCPKCGRAVLTGREVVELTLGIVGQDYDDFALTDAKTSVRFHRECFEAINSAAEIIEPLIPLNLLGVDG